MSVAVRTSGEPAGRGSFVVPSATMPGEVWAVEYIGPGTAWCGCPAFARRQTCRHVEAVAWAVEAEAFQQIENTTPEQRAAAATRLSNIEELFSR
jgi:hypothetical protein